MRKKKNKKYFKSNRKRPSKHLNKSFNFYDNNKKVNIFKHSNSCVFNYFENFKKNIYELKKTEEIFEDLNDDNDLFSFENQSIQTARNKWRNNEKQMIEQNFNEVLEIKDKLTIYKYSNVEGRSTHELIYQYYYDDFDSNDYKNAKIILFIGKTGDGKSTAINAFFNIIKGIKIEDKYRYILIKERKKEKGQAESQTDGLHLYYIKDNNNNPIIIIDSQGYGDTRGKEYDEKINKAFEYAFTNIIDHINTICFIAKSNESRLDTLIKYIFSCVTSLFSEDLIQNIIFLCTFANKSTIKKVPQFIESISTEKNFKTIIEKMNTKFWYVVESISIFDDDIKDKLSQYSFNQLYQLYEEKVKNSQSKNISISTEIIKNRNEINTIIKKIILKSQTINPEKEKIKEKEKIIKEYDNKIYNIEYNIENKKTQISMVYVPNINNEIYEIERQRDNIIYNLDNQYEQRTVRKTKYYGGNNTYCTYCKSNCHCPCDCFGALFDRCEVFSFFSKICEDCGHHKDSHCVRSSCRYVDEYESIKVNNYYKIQQERNYYQRRIDEARNEYYRKKEKKDNLEEELNDLYNQKYRLNNQKYNYINEKEEINENIKAINKDIILVIMELLNISNKIKNNAMNQFHADIENEYIESLIVKIEDIGNKDDNKQIKQLKEFKKYGDIYQELKNISEEELTLNDPEYFLKKLKIVF